MTCTKCGSTKWEVRPCYLVFIGNLEVLGTCCATKGCREWYMTPDQLYKMSEKIDENANEARKSKERPAT